MTADAGPRTGRSDAERPSQPTPSEKRPSPSPSPPPPPPSLPPPPPPAPDADSPICYLYLDFDTALPTLALGHGRHRRRRRLERCRGDRRAVDDDSSSDDADSDADGQKLPRCPDLAPYVSPLQWGPARKNVLLAMSCIATFATAYTAGAYSPPAPIMAHDLATTRLVVLVGITTFCVGFGLAPMALAPISEIWGRFPVFVAAGLVFVVFQALCSVMPHVAGLLVARFFVGAGASVFSAVVGGVIADVWDKEDRNTPMALFSGSVIAGTGAGPLVATALISRVSDPTLAWKWSFWHQAILDAAMLVAIVFLCRESRASVLLTRKAAALNAWYEALEQRGVYGLWLPADSPLARMLPAAAPPDATGHRGRLLRIRWLVLADQQRPAVAKLVAQSVKRPFHMLLTEPVVFCFSLWAAFSWGILYLSFSVVPYLYGADLDRSSRVYVAMMVAAAVATAVGIAQEQLLRHPQWRAHDASEQFRYSKSRFWALLRRRFPAEAPEARLYFACFTALMLPAGLFGAFLSPRDTYGHAEAVGLGFALWGIYSIYLATFNYLADTYHVYASSALAAQSFCRNMLAGVFPLITGSLFTDLGLDGAGGLLGGIATGLTLIPWVLVFWGPRIRARSKLALSLSAETVAMEGEVYAFPPG